MQPLTKVNTELQQSPSLLGMLSPSMFLKHNINSPGGNEPEINNYMLFVNYFKRYSKIITHLSI